MPGVTGFGYGGGEGKSTPAGKPPLLVRQSCNCTRTLAQALQAPELYFHDLVADLFGSPELAPDSKKVRCGGACHLGMPREQQY